MLIGDVRSEHVSNIFSDSKFSQNFHTQNVFVPFIQGQLHRVPIKWILSGASTLRTACSLRPKSKCGKGIKSSANLPENCQQFLRIDANKIEWFSSLAEPITCMDLSTWYNHVKNKPRLPCAILIQVVMCSPTQF